MKPEVGVIGGSGFYEFLEGREVWVNTSYGPPSDKILLGGYKGRGVAFLPRHGRDHHLPPHKINYRANLFAFKKLGVERILAPCAAGSLKPEIKPGHFLIAHQFIDRTKNRKDTFYNGPKVVHIALAEPYCPALRALAVGACEELGVNYHKEGTAVVIEGPRFSTKAESELYSQVADIINMTQYPEVVLAKELGMCYVSISLITDYDAGLRNRNNIEPVSAQKVKEVFRQNTTQVKKLILKIIENMPEDLACQCAGALQEAVL